MNPTPGEQLVGAYLKLIEGCNVVDYNAKPPGGGLEGLQEFDVIGLDFQREAAFLCEVSTHIRGLQLGSSYQEAEDTVRGKYERQQAYAEAYLEDFPHRQFQFWSPVVPRGDLLRRLEGIEGLELICNEEYARRIEELCEDARNDGRRSGNAAYRVIQILEHLRRG